MSKNEHHPFSLTVITSGVLIAVVATLISTFILRGIFPENSHPAVQPTQENIPVSITQIIIAVTATSLPAAAPTGELKMEDLVVGTGAIAKAGDTVSVNYTGWLQDGTKFDSSLDRNQPFEFVLGKGNVIAGWDQGVVGMKVGGKRKLTIPPNLGYGAEVAGGVIPPNATMIFEVELLAIK